MEISFADIEKAGERLRNIIHATNLEKSATFSRMTAAEVFLKMENLQKTGSFKIRGAYNKIASLNALEKERGVIAASAGNHAQGVAMAARESGINACIVMPETAPITKVLATREYGAQVVLHGQNYDEAYHKAREIQSCSGATFIHAFDDPMVIAGQGTLGIEIYRQLPEMEMIFVPVGGGGLASGVAIAAKHLNPRIKVIGVEAEGAACLLQSRMAGQRKTLTDMSTIADGIAVKCPGELTYALLEKYLDDVVTVNDEEIAGTILQCLERAKIVVEGAGAAALAAVLYGKTQARNKKVTAVISGGNIDVNFISLIIEKGLMKAGRHMRLATLMPDKPGKLQAFLQIIAQERGNIISINHDRGQAFMPIDQARVEAVVETQGHDHGERIIHALESRGFKPEFKL